MLKIYSLVERSRGVWFTGEGESRGTSLFQDYANPAGEEAIMILVTGVNGLIGSTVIREFACQEYPVRALVRNRAKAKTLEALPGVEVVEGDMLRPETLGRALDGVDPTYVHRYCQTGGRPPHSQAFRCHHVIGFAFPLFADARRNLALSRTLRTRLTLLASQPIRDGVFAGSAHHHHRTCVFLAFRGCKAHPRGSGGCRESRLCAADPTRA